MESLLSLGSWILRWIAGEMVGAAERIDGVEVRLRRWCKEKMIGSDGLEVGARLRLIFASLVERLLKHDGSVKLTSLVVHAAIASSSDTELFVRTAFEHNPALDITREDLMSLINA